MSIIKIIYIVVSILLFFNGCHKHGLIVSETKKKEIANLSAHSQENDYGYVVFYALNETFDLDHVFIGKSPLGTRTNISTHILKGVIFKRQTGKHVFTIKKDSFIKKLRVHIIKNHLLIINIESDVYEDARKSTDKKKHHIYTLRIIPHPVILPVLKKRKSMRNLKRALKNNDWLIRWFAIHILQSFKSIESKALLKYTAHKDSSIYVREKALE